MSKNRMTYLRETLNPKFWGNSDINFLIIVDFPQPLGPERTIGLNLLTMVLTVKKTKKEDMYGITGHISS